MEPIRILHVVGAMNRAGTETMLMNIYRNIDRREIQFDFVSYSRHDAHYDQEIREMGGKVITLAKTSSIKALYNVIKRHGPYHAVHGHTLFHCGITSIAALLAGVKIRISHAHTTLDDSHSLSRKLYITFMRGTINTFSTNLLACSNGAGDYLFGKRGRMKMKYDYFPNVIEYANFLHTPQAEIAKFKAKEGLENSIVIGHIGRFIEAKNHAFLLDMMKFLVQKNPTVTLLLVGDGDLREQVEATAKKEGIQKNIRFVGIRNDITTMLHCMDVFVFPSLYEGLGLVLLEAQASGIPCIVSGAIQPEADVNIGLVTKLSLNDGPNVWADKAIELAFKKERDVNKIIKGFEKSGYSLTKGISTLKDIYKSNPGGAYERNFDRLV